MPWTKKPVDCQPNLKPTDWSEKVRALDPEDQGSQRVTYVEKDTKAINLDQLDPSYVTLQMCIEEGMKIEPGNVQHMLDITDRADLEKANTSFTQDLYNYLKENYESIIKSYEDTVKSQESN